MAPRAVLLAVVFCLGFAFSACQRAAEQQAPIGPGPRVAGAVSFPCFRPPQLQPTLPGDSPIADQNNFNCFAWQEFVALNWLASPTNAGQPDTTKTAAQFGIPNDLTPVVWETYKEPYEIFLPAAAQPSAWGAPQQLPSGCGQVAAARGAAAARPHVLRMQSKFSDQVSTSQVLDEVLEAFTNSWLSAQNGNQAHYEIRVNQDFYNYVVIQNQFFNSLAQYQAVQPGGPGINLPSNLPSGNRTSVGAIEIKAAWVEIDDPTLWPRYKMSNAMIYDPSASPPCRAVTVALVGLHIAHKTQSAPQWVWATFEHVSNCPDVTQVKNPTPPYLFFNPNCSPRTAPQCQPNRAPQPGDPTNRPVQVVRTTVIPGTLDDSVQQINAAMQQLITQANPSSVWQYYQLVNVLWPPSASQNRPGANIPLTEGGATPQYVANTTMETYINNQLTNCLDCHRSATIAPSSQAGNSPQWASDYSFQLSKAQQPSSGSARRR